MRTFCESAAGDGIENMAFGELFLQDIRNYRETQLPETGIQPIFSLWNVPTGILAEAMLATGVEAYISCVDPQRLPADFTGRR